MTKKIYLQTLKSALGRSILHYLNWLKASQNEVNQAKKTQKQT